MNVLERIEVETHQLRPHDRVIDSPPDHLPRGVEVTLVTGPFGNPFPAAQHAAVLNVFASGTGGSFNAEGLWEVERQPLDDCRSCFLYRAARPNI
ncbi:MAG: hypothetical protein R3320_09585 [Nitriliruptorales bacterium]|nr:hypothetical protein [Nitriliruptorales bacterium]